jgi:hypothetical protein
MVNSREVGMASHLHAFRLMVSSEKQKNATPRQQNLANASVRFEGSHVRPLGRPLPRNGLSARERGGHLFRAALVEFLELSPSFHIQ